MDFTKVGKSPATGEIVSLENDLLNRNQVVLKLEESRVQVDSIVNAIKCLEVTDDKTNQEMSSYILIAAKLTKAVAVNVDALTAPARDFIAFVKNFGKGFTVPLAVQMASGKTKIGNFAADLELIRRKEEAALKREYEQRQAQLDRDAKKAKVAPVTLPPPVIKRDKKTATQTTEGKTTTSLVWTFEVQDAEAVPREFCSPDDKKLRESVKAGRREIPGVRIYEKAQVRAYT